MNDPGPAIDAEEAARSAANLALWLGIASLFLCAPALGPFAIYKGIRGASGSKSTRAAIGIVCGALGLVTSFFFWFLAIWQFLEPASRP